MPTEIDQAHKEIREISGHSIEVLIVEQAIRERLVVLADQIYDDYYRKDRDPLFICVLKGAEPTFIWLGQELGRGNPNTQRKPVSVRGGHIGLSSYGASETSGELKNTSELSVQIKGEDVIIVEDIVDSGKTMDKAIKTIFQPENPKSIEIFALLDKEEGREIPVDVKYIGFKIPKRFVVGFGLDLDETKLRNLPFVGVSLLKP